MGVLPLSRDAVSVFYRPSRLRKKCNKVAEKSIKLASTELGRWSTRNGIRDQNLTIQPNGIYKPESVLKNEIHKIFWYLYIQTEKWTQDKIKPLKYADCKYDRKIRSYHPRKKSVVLGMTVNSISWWFHFQWRYTKRTPVDGTARYNNHRAPLMTPVLNLIFTGCSTLLAQYQINMRLVNSWFFQNAWRTIMQRRLLTLVCSLV